MWWLLGWCFRVDDLKGISSIDRSIVISIFLSLVCRWFCQRIAFDLSLDRNWHRALGGYELAISTTSRMWISTGMGCT